ncbi:sugar ABC transporter ATP-binding protein [Parafrankia discariae]|uniref:sugar ABC transporter ATP-binding protein n=1 Tax=Parafrankia discariae TaxID=365528 RepID=UPI0003653BD1|nr:sugar ABC transporter ATP-binding protein [Parafrankia discariae]
MTLTSGTDADESTQPLRLRVERVSKTFGRSCALHDVSLDLRPGEIHGLVGQNGSGKSTLAKVLTGYHAPDPGARVLVDGVPLRLPIRPIEARSHGLAVVHQSLGLVNDHTVVENLRMGRLRAGRYTRRIHWQREIDEAQEVLSRFGRSVRLDAKVGSLPEEDRATVAIARAIQDARRGKGVVIFDESTRSLARESLEHFYELLDEVVATGTAALLITHRLEEICDAADRVTVLRDGSAVESGLSTAGLCEADLVNLVLGRTLQVLDRPAARAAPPGPQAADKAITLTGVAGKIVRDVDIRMAPREVLGVTGLAASGHDELPYLVAGARRARAGQLTMGDVSLDLATIDCQTAIAAGLVLVPEGREHAGLAFEISVAENIALPLSRGRRGSLMPVNVGAERSLVAGWIDALDVRPPDSAMPVGKLSGGNQQKVLLAKWLAMRPRVLILHEPTQAVDVGARRTIVEAVRAAAAQGCTVLVAGSDENELALLCDRVLVFRDGRVAEELTGDITTDAIITATFASGTRRALRPSSRAENGVTTGVVAGVATGSD